MLKYDFLVNFSVEASTEERAEEQLQTYLKMAKLDHALTYGIKDSQLVEFLVEERNHS